MDIKLTESYFRKELTVTPCQSEKMFVVVSQKSVQGSAIFFTHDSGTKNIFIKFSDAMKL